MPAAAMLAVKPVVVFPVIVRIDGEVEVKATGASHHALVSPGSTMKLSVLRDGYAEELPAVAG